MSNGTTSDALARSGNTTLKHADGREIAHSGETAKSALEAHAQASVQARFVMALQRPRDWEDVRVRLLKECDRKSFAEAAWYKVPNRGEGFSIRFAEACLRLIGNCDASATVIFEDAMKRIYHVRAIDFETNASFGADVEVSKTIERRESKGRVIVAKRTNSTGDTVYILEATDEELLGKTNSQISKAARTEILRLVPGDIKDECKRRLLATIRASDAADPDAAKRAVIDAFAEAGVKPSDLAEYLGHSLDQVTPAEVADLRAVCAAVKQGEFSWTEILSAKTTVATKGTPEASQADKVTKRIEERKKAQNEKQTKGKKGETKPAEEKKADKAEEKKAAAAKEPERTYPPCKAENDSNVCTRPEGHDGEHFDEKTDAKWGGS